MFAVLWRQEKVGNDGLLGRDSQLSISVNEDYSVLWRAGAVLIISVVK